MQYVLSPIILGTTTFLLCFCLCLVFRKLAHKLGLIDITGSEERKDHIGNPALVGGTAIFLTIAIMSFIWLAKEHLYSFIPVLTGMGAFVVIGVYDDARHIPALKKLSLQIAVITSTVIIFDTQINNLGHIISASNPLELGMLAPVFTILCILLYINAFNLIDGVDGLAGMIALYTTFFLGMIAAKADMASYPTIGLIILCAISGFLVLNLRTYWRRKALVFLGDSGSLSLSFALALIIITMASHTPQNTLSPPPIVYAFILSYPIYDMVSVMLYRFSIGRSIFAADTNHLHHLLKNTGIPVSRTTLILSSLSTIYAGIGILLWQADLSDKALLAIWLVCFTFHISIYMLFRKKHLIENKKA